MEADFSKTRRVVLDMDGTIYLGGTLFRDTRPFLATLNNLGIGYSFVTNNCSRSRKQYIAHLREMGLDADAEVIWTSAQATISYLRANLPLVERLFVLGTDGLHDEFREAGFGVVDVGPDAVVVGFDNQLTYDRLALAAYWISKNLPYVATHPDRVCPTDQPMVLPDCGAICALLESATGRKPDAVPGKPNRGMLQSIFDAYGLEPHEVVVVGDRLYTDIRMACDAGAISVLTLTGETTAALVDATADDCRPDFVVSNLGELAQLLREARNAS
jgi:HAD superfamily hydrolase (TIGR01450 family)